MEFLIVGAGSVGKALATNLIDHGHSVTFAVRKPSSAFVPPGCTAAALDTAVPTETVRILAVPFAAVTEVVPQLDLPDGCVLVDATNPFGRSVPGGAHSAAELVSELAGGHVRVVKAFNVLGAEQMVSPETASGTRPLLPVASEHEHARRMIVDLALSLGFDAIEVGGIEAAATLEDAAKYWGLLAFAGGLGREFVLVADRRATIGGATS